MSYSVLYEPVISVRMPDDSFKSIGMRESILSAHLIEDIVGSNPLERYAVLRLLIAFAMDMMHPKTGYDRKELLQAGRFDPNIVDAYIADCEKDGPRFDLFDPEYPFIQSKYDEKLDEKAEKPVAVILHALPSGNNHVFIDHRSADSHSIAVPDAFRALCASYVFCAAGLAGPSGVNNTPPLYTVMRGASLFETIVINMISEAEAKPLPYGTGEVPWRKNRVVIPKEQVAAVSLLEGMTWMPRRITLIREQDGGTIRRVYCQAGLDFKGNDLWNDPHVPRFRKKDNTFGTVKPELGRELWRDAGTLLYDHDSKKIRQPMTLRCLMNVYDEEDLPVWIVLRTAGLITNQAAYTGWCEGELSLPSVFLYDQDKADVFRDDILLIEQLQSQIYINVQRYYDKPRVKGSSAEHEIAVQCQQYFLKAAHDLLFGDGITEICGDASAKEHSQHICAAVKKLIQNTLTHVLYATGNSTNSMMKQIEAEKWIWISFNKTTKERMEQYAGS